MDDDTPFVLFLFLFFFLLFLEQEGPRVVVVASKKSEQI